MRLARIAIILAAAPLLGAGCADLERSRDLANPQVSSVTLARQVCSNCHGVTGNAVSPNFPNLAQQTADYLGAQLREFRAHSRQDPAGFEYMWGLSRGLTDAQIDGLARYYAEQRLAPSPGGSPAPATTVAAGRAIFESGVPERSIPACTACHGSGGQGNGPFPRIAGQHADYVAKQLLVFQRTDERPAGSVMKTVAHGLTIEDIRNVAAFVQTMR